ncbi:MAG: monovalent cation/H(+) antiporter subunit G [Ignavibacterium sp.]|nr:monovalent cation/H(+) antiporter subunit G [Ignavibacterium sp.]
MIEIKDILTIIFLLVGGFFMFVGSAGIIRLPDFFSRTHAITMGDTLGIILIVTGLIFYQGLSLNSLKLLIIFVFIALSNPVGSHAIARAAFTFGIKPWFKKRNQKD